jgi:hypothetical protein
LFFLEILKELRKATNDLGIPPRPNENRALSRKRSPHQLNAFPPELGENHLKIILQLQCFVVWPFAPTHLKPPMKSATFSKASF